MLDLSAMTALGINVDHHTAWAQTGLTAGEYSTAAGAYGLATGFGDTGSVGLGGLTLGGGIGYLVRRHGLTIDDLLAAELVTADGQLLRTDDQHQPDLFWAIRGGCDMVCAPGYASWPLDVTAATGCSRRCGRCYIGRQRRQLLLAHALAVTPHRYRQSGRPDAGARSS